MNVYDFDKTIYAKDSQSSFLFFLWKKYPRKVNTFRVIKNGFCYILGIISIEQMKSNIFSFLKDIDVESEVSLFWDTNEKYINKWYIDKHQDDDVVVSGSCQFLLAEICQRLNIKYVLGTLTDNNYQVIGRNCTKEEKVNRFEKEFNKEIDEFYSDSNDDLPMAKLAKKAYKVKGDKIKLWIIR